MYLLTVDTIKLHILTFISRQHKLQNARSFGTIIELEMILLRQIKRGFHKTTLF